MMSLCTCVSLAGGVDLVVGACRLLAAAAAAAAAVTAS